jgi:hypothetical protein
VQYQWAKEGNVFEQQIAVPEHGPRNQDQEDANFKAKQNEGNS